jgi:hypothetical protein
MALNSSNLSAGRAGETVKLRTSYDKYTTDTQTTGGSALAWPDWLKTQGYALGGDNLVNKLED